MPAVTLDTAPVISPNGRRAVRLTPCIPGAMVAATDILTVALTPIYGISLLRVTVASDVASIFRCHVHTGATNYQLAAEQGVPIAADALYTWDIPVASGSQLDYNFNFLLAATVKYFSIEELEAPQ